jgi:hypothetical protein
MAARAEIQAIEHPGQQALHLEAEGAQNHCKETVDFVAVAATLMGHNL